MANVPVPFETQMQLPKPENRFSDLLDTFFSEVQKHKVFTPAADLYETDKGYELYVYVPGVKKEDVSLQVIGGSLFVKGEKKEFAKDNNRKKHWSETGLGRFERQFDFPQKADLGNAEAELAEGILYIFVPKNEEKAKTQKIGVK